MARAAFLGQVGDQVQHQREIGPVTLEAPFLLDGEQKHSPSGIRQQNGTRASERGLADPALAGKEQMPG